MTEPIKINWGVAMRLQVVKKIGALLRRRWSLQFGYVAEDNKDLADPSIAALLSESIDEKSFKSGTAMATLAAPELGLAVPVALEGRVQGALYCRGFRDETQATKSSPRSNDSALPSLDQREVAFIATLLEEASTEISSYFLSQENQKNPNQRTRYPEIIGAGEAMQKLYDLLDRVVQSDSTVLVTGENGTGKELVAKAIHYNSGRHDKSFVIQNCSAFNDNLLDSELFGHVRGAFTGAISDKKGLFEVADQGTFFLDEIGDMSPSLQVKVLRVLQEGTFTPVGGTVEKQVDVRIVAATNRDLQQMVSKGSFREDLYYRVNVINIELPPLRDRPSDIAVLGKHFLQKHEGGEKRLSPDCLARMAAYAWPGNVRELENEIERLIVLSGNTNTLSAELLSERMKPLSIAPRSATPIAPSTSLPDALRAVEKQMIRAALVANDWNKTRAAAKLKVSRRNLIRLVQKYELEEKKGLLR